MHQLVNFIMDNLFSCHNLWQTHKHFLIWFFSIQKYYWKMRKFQY